MYKRVDKSSQYDNEIARNVAEWAKRLHIQTRMQVFDLPDSIAIVIFLSALGWRVIKPEYTKRPLYSFYIFSWIPLLQAHSTSALHYDLRCIRIRRKEPLLSTAKLWVRFSRRTPRMKSSPKLMLTWWVFCNHPESCLQNSQTPFGKKRLDETEYMINMCSGDSLSRDYHNSSDTVCPHTGIQRGTSQLTSWWATELRWQNYNMIGALLKHLSSWQHG